MYESDAIALLAREVLRERASALIAEACAWSVGLSDRPHHTRRHGRITSTGLTLGMLADNDQQLGLEDDARPGSFGDALAALTPEGRLYSELLDDEVLTPFVMATCVAAVERARTTRPEAYEELLDELGDDGSDPEEVVRGAEWEAPLKTEAEHLVVAALADVPLVEVESEGLPLSLVRAAEAATRAAVPAPPPEPVDVSGALFLAEAALRAGDLPLPVPPSHAAALVQALTAEGIEPDEVLVLLPHLPVLADTADEVAALLRRAQ